jgi:monofunctional biosynthetic peptidoglycan transglycosylase
VKILTKKWWTFWKTQIWPVVWRVGVLALGTGFFYLLILIWVPVPGTFLMVSRKLGMKAGQKVDYRWVPVVKISPHFLRAVQAGEDQNFFYHHGFDWEAIRRARTIHHGGGSGISQQTAKNVFLWLGGGYFRKALEAGFTLGIELFWGKDRILEVYCNVAELGDGIFGVEAAAWYYFKKPADRLSVTEAAALATILPAPRRWNPLMINTYPGLSQRYAQILAAMSRMPVSKATAPKK